MDLGAPAGNHSGTAVGRFLDTAYQQASQGCTSAITSNTPPGEKWRFCPSDGKPLDAVWLFCPHCGKGIGVIQPAWWGVTISSPYTGPVPQPNCSPTVFSSVSNITPCGAD